VLKDGIKKRDKLFSRELKKPYSWALILLFQSDLQNPT
jgi:hypothetical protein